MVEGGGGEECLWRVDGGIKTGQSWPGGAFLVPPSLFLLLLLLL